MTTNTDLQKILTADLEYIAALDKLVDDLDKTIKEKATSHNRKHYEALQTMPGCGVTTALTILYETHTIHRFRTPQRFSSYSRVVRAENESAGKNLGSTSNDKIGNPYLKWAIAEIGQSMIKNYQQIYDWHANLASVHGKAKAHARLRHKIAVAVYFMLKHDKVFDMKKFLGNKKDQTENPTQQWTETPGQQSEPVFNTENPSGSSHEKTIRSGIKRKTENRIMGRSSLRTTGKGKVLA